MSARTLNAVQAWRQFARAHHVVWASRRRSWLEHTKGDGYIDEARVIQPVMFPAFAEELLGFTTGLNLAPEESGAEGIPDFTPADSVTHPFVFETKSTAEGTELSGHEEQVRRYLIDGRPRIKKVALTNLVGLRVFELDEHGQITEKYSVPLKGLLSGPESEVAAGVYAERLANFIDEFSRKELTLKEKL
jgi:hypothetical protein